MQILLDTNFVLIPGQFRIDIFSQLKGNQLFILDRTLEELKKISKAKLALSLLKKNKVKILKTESTKSTDDLILEIAKKKQIAVATQDKLLKQRLKKNKVKIITLRQKKYLITF